MLKAITVARNEEKLIGKCIKGVLSQTYQVNSYLIIDDFSSDSTPEIIERLNDGRVKLFRAEFLNSQALITRALNLEGDQMSQEIWNERNRMRVKALVKMALDFSGDWDYMLYIDADTFIPPHYCEVIIKEMKENPRLVLGGAKYLKTPNEVQASPDSHVRGTGYIMKRNIYDLFHAAGYDFLNPFGEVALERFAKANGYEVKSLPELFVQHDRSVHSSASFPQGVNEYLISTPLLALAINFLKKPSRRNILVFFGWMWAWKHGMKRYFNDLEHKRLMVWSMKQWLRLA